MSASVAAAAVLGDLKTGSAGTMTITLGSITFEADPSSNPPGAPWNAEVANGTSLTFFNCSGVLGSANCLDASPFTPTEAIQVATVTSGGGAITNFIQFAGNGVSHATLVYSLLTAGPESANLNCATVGVGDSCSIFAGSPLILTKSGNGTTITFAVSGRASDTGVAGLASGNIYVGQFSGMVAGQTPSQILLFFCSTGICTPSDFTSGKSLSLSQSGDFLVNAP